MSIIENSIETNTNNNELSLKNTEALESLLTAFKKDFYPSHICDNSEAVSLPLEDSLSLLNSFFFYKICDCKVYNEDEKQYEFFAVRMQKLFTVAHSLNYETCYGIVSCKGTVSLILGINPTSSNESIPIIIQGLLPGLRLEKFENKFVNAKCERTGSHISVDKDRHVGCIAGTPVLKENGVIQHKDLSTLIRSLNGKDYTIMVMNKPISRHEIQELLDMAFDIKDKAFAISKRTLSYQNGVTDSVSHSKSTNKSESRTETKFTSIGIGKGVGGNAGKSTSKSFSRSIGESNSLSKAISRNASISGDIQNSFALQIMEMADKVISRLKTGIGIGMWKSVISYSSDSEMAAKIIKGSLYSEISSSSSDILPPVVFEYQDSCTRTNHNHTQQVMIPDGFFSKDNISSPLASLMTSEELSAICSIPTERTIGFDIQRERPYALNYSLSPADHIIGSVCEYDRPLPNVPFGFSDEDLNKHTLVCGITGCGKTNTVKKILTSINKPFMVIEPAKKEYRNIRKENVSVYTLGRPEINCLRLNPFYIPRGISPQQHIDLLKDLFSASFAFYGPMPYIMEKCLNNIYIKKGWNLTLGFHPYLAGKASLQNLFAEDRLNMFYSMKAHRYLFPTMQDLKDEITRYINNEMTYKGEVKGNIEGAIKARIDSLCIGAKGYMFNTTDFADFDKLLSGNTVIELEGLADDSDKAYALGLIIIYINEFRQVKKELDNRNELKHLLVIEEAHRLLKNVSTESNEDLGNPKGKAVEHFTNMLAEMRSYGQGVIVAEQIPSKLAPEIIKNSSNKIIHRLVSKDDQEVIANSIGVYPEDAIFLGNSKVGYALCHKEGMVQPVIVKIDEEKSNVVLDINLYNRNIVAKMNDITKSIIKANIPDEISIWAIRILNSLMYFKSIHVIHEGIYKGYEILSDKLSLKGVALLPGVNKEKCILSVLADEIITLIASGAFSARKMPDNKMVDLISDVICNSRSDIQLLNLQDMLENFYGKNLLKKAISINATLAIKHMQIATDPALDNLLVVKSTDFGDRIRNYIRR